MGLGHVVLSGTGQSQDRRCVIPLRGSRPGRACLRAALLQGAVRLGVQVVAAHEISVLTGTARTEKRRGLYVVRFLPPRLTSHVFYHNFKN